MLSWRCVLLTKLLADGDCGSWVVQRENRQWVGQIVARRPHSSLVFVILASHIVEDIQARLRARVEILTKYNHPEMSKISLLRSGGSSIGGLDPSEYQGPKIQETSTDHRSFIQTNSIQDA